MLISAGMEKIKKRGFLLETEFHDVENQFTSRIDTTTIYEYISTTIQKFHLEESSHNLSGGSIPQAYYTSNAIMYNNDKELFVDESVHYSNIS